MNGWHYMEESKKWHYFIGLESICGLWFRSGWGELEPKNPPQQGEKSDCGSCHRILEQKRAKFLKTVGKSL